MNWGNGNIAKQSELDRAARDLADRENSLVEKQGELDRTASSLADRENRLTMQDAEVGRRDRLSRSREARIDDEVAGKVQASVEAELGLRLAELDATRDGLAARSEELASLEAGIVERARATAGREALLRSAEDRLRSRESQEGGRAEAFASREAELADRGRKLLDREMAADAAIARKGREALEALAGEHASLVARIGELNAELAEARRTRFESLETELAEEARRRRQSLDQELQEARHHAEAIQGQHRAAIDEQAAEHQRLRVAVESLRADLARTRVERFEQLESELAEEAARRRESLDREAREASRRVSAALEEEARALGDAERLRTEVAARLDSLDSELAEARRSRTEALVREVESDADGRRQALDRSIEEAERMAVGLREGHRSAIDALAVEHGRLVDNVQALQADLARARVERFEQLDRELIEESTARRDALAEELRRARHRAGAELSGDLDARRSEADRVRDELAVDRERLRAVEAGLLAREDSARVKNVQLSSELLMLEEDRELLQKRLDERVERATSDMRRDCEMKDRRIDDLRDACEQREHRLSAFEDLARRFGQVGPEEIERRQRELEKRLESLRDELSQRPALEVKERLKRALDEQATWKAQLEAAGRELSMLRSERSKWLTSVGELEEQKNLCETTIRVKDALLAQIQVIDAELERLKGMNERPEEREARIGVIRMEYLERERCIDFAPSEVDWLAHIHNMCNRSGLFFPKRLMDAFHTSLKTAEWSPVTVLAGVSGTGKSELPRLYSRFGGLNFLGLPVQPNWDGPQSLFGFFNSVDNRFNATPLLQSLEQAQRDPRAGRGLGDQMLVVLLDEMNLAHVELYFSDLLSKLESRRGRAEEWLEVDIGAGFDKHRLALTRNVLWVGTMNEDETTKTLSDKVLDRSNIIGFPRPKELRRRESADLEEESLRLPWDVWCSWNRPTSWFADDQIRPFKDMLQDINAHLERAGRALGHRVWQSIEHYMANHPTVLEAVAASDAEALSRALVLAFEDQLVQKVMPKLRGIETGGKHRSECLEPIRSRLDTFEGLHLLEDFELACSSDFGGFVWKSAHYLEAGE